MAALHLAVFALGARPAAAAVMLAVALYLAASATTKRAVTPPDA